MGGLAKPMPVLAGFFLFFSLGSLGLPGLSGFVGEFLSLLGLFHYSHALGAVAAIGVILAACYLLWMFQRVMFNDRGDPDVMPAFSMRDFGLREIASLAAPGRVRRLGRRVPGHVPQPAARAVADDHRSGGAGARQGARAQPGRPLQRDQGAVLGMGYDNSIVVILPARRHRRRRPCSSCSSMRSPVARACCRGWRPPVSSRPPPWPSGQWIQFTGGLRLQQSPARDRLRPHGRARQVRALLRRLFRRYRRAHHHALGRLPERPWRRPRRVLRSAAARHRRHGRHGHGDRSHRLLRLLRAHVAAHLRAGRLPASRREVGRGLDQVLRQRRLRLGHPRLRPRAALRHHRSDQLRGHRRRR